MADPCAMPFDAPRNAALLYPRISLYALILAAAGIPLYLHLPRFAAVDLGLGLGALGGVLLTIRLIDLFQDPFFGWAIDRWPEAQSAFGFSALLGLGLGFPLLFNLAPGPGLIWKLVPILMLLFSAYSLGMILLYGRTSSLAKRPDAAEITRMASWREVGMLAGVILAAILPSALIALGAPGQGYGAFGLSLGAVAIVIALISQPMWRRPVHPGSVLSLKGLHHGGALRLLTLAFLNSLPVAITSTLFLFFVEDQLQLAGQAGPLLIVFFAAAGLSVPVWARISQRLGRKATLMLAMPLAILGFVGAALLAPGNFAGFALICAASGAALGADMVILPVMFSLALTRAGQNPAAAFGLWSFAGKLGLAIAAFAVLPLLEWQGFAPGADNSPKALATLTIAYAVLPCVLKLAAFALVLTLPHEDKLS